MATWLVPQMTNAQVETANAGDTVNIGDLIYNSTNRVLMVGVPVTGSDPDFVAVGDVSATANNSIALAKLVNGTGNEVLITDAAGVTTDVSMGENEILSRSDAGIVSQKLQDLMIATNTISHAKLVNITPGHLLGALENSDPNDVTPVAVGPVAINDIRGANVSAGASAPSNPSENDLWYYQGEENNDSARLYIYRGSSWIDASPAIVNTNQGADGAKGADGDSVRSITIQARSDTDDVVFSFYNDADRQINDTLISSATLPLADIQIANVPTAPSNMSDARKYTLDVPISGDAAWNQLSVATADIADNAVTAAKLNVTGNGSDNQVLVSDGDGSMTWESLATVHVGDASITTAKLANDAVTYPKIDIAGTAGQVLQVNSDASNWEWATPGAASIADGAVTEAKIANNAVTTDKINDDAVTSAKLADNSVVTASITDANVTHAKLAANAVETDNITDAHVTTAKIADDAVTYAKMQDVGTANRVLGSTSANGTVAEVQVATDMIADTAVTNAKIADDTITEAKLDIHNDPSDGQVLEYDSTNGMQWTTAAAGNLSGLSDTSISSASDDQFLRYDGTNWVNETVTIPAAVPTFPTGDSTTQLSVLQTTGASGSESRSWVDVPTYSAGTGLSLSGTTFSIAASHNSETHVFTTTALRNSHTSVAWTQGDIALISGNSTAYIYIGTNQSTGAATTDSDWATLTFTTTTATYTGQTTAGNYTVPVRDSGGTTTKFLREDGDWVAPSGTSYTAGNGLTLSSNAFSVDAHTGITVDTNGVSVTNPVPTLPSGISNDTTRDYVLRLTDASGTETLSWQQASSNSTFTGASNSAAGTGGLVPAPSAGEDDEWLRGDATWASLPTAGASTLGIASAGAGLTSSNGSFSVNVRTPSYPDITNNTSQDYVLRITDSGGTQTEAWQAYTTPTTFGGADGTNAGSSGLVPAPGATENVEFLRGDGTWAVPTDTNTTYAAFTGADGTNAGTAGLVVAPRADENEDFLRGDGTWAAPSSATDINGQTALTDIANADTFIVYDDSASANRKITATNLVYNGTASQPGLVPVRDSGSTTTKFLREDGDWVVPSSTAVKYVQDAEPSSPSAGDLWYYTGDDGSAGDVARLFVYVTDSNSVSAWIAASPSAEVPNAPAKSSSTTAYNLQVASSGGITWEAVGEIDINGLTAATPVAADTIAFADTSATDDPTRKVTITNAAPVILGAGDLSDLSDVHTATPTDGQVLTWDNANSRWAPAAAASGSSGYTSPTGGDLIVSDTTNTTLGTGFQAIELEAETDAATTFYISGGVEYRSLGNSTVRGLRMLNPQGIANGQLYLFAGGDPANASKVSPSFRTSMIYDNDNNGFVGYPVQSTFHGNASNTYMAWGANGSSTGTPAQYILSTVLTGTTSNINIGLYHGGTIDGTIVVEAGQTVTLGIQNANTNGNRTRLYANKVS